MMSWHFVTLTLRPRWRYQTKKLWCTRILKGSQVKCEVPFSRFFLRILAAPFLLSDGSALTSDHAMWSLSSSAHSALISSQPLLVSFTTLVGRTHAPFTLTSGILRPGPDPSPSMGALFLLRACHASFALPDFMLVSLFARIVVNGVTLRHHVSFSALSVLSVVVCITALTALSARAIPR